jgi:hypothetical protein
MKLDDFSPHILAKGYNELKFSTLIEFMNCFLEDKWF